MEHQDWNTTFLTKSKPKVVNKTYVKPIGISDDEKKHKKIGLDFKLALIKARNSKKLSQKQLAQQINVTPSLIQNYENGKAVPNGEIINKLNRLFGIKLPKCK